MLIMCRFGAKINLGIKDQQIFVFKRQTDKSITSQGRQFSRHVSLINLGGAKLAEMVRVNTRISSTLNDWLDKESESTGVPKSTLVMLALENFHREREVMSKMGDLTGIMKMLEEMKVKFDNN